MPDDDEISEADADAAIGFTARRQELRRELRAICAAMRAGAVCTSEAAPAPMPPDALSWRHHEP
jgi:hypothetical protein